MGLRMILLRIIARRRSCLVHPRVVPAPKLSIGDCRRYGCRVCVVHFHHSENAAPTTQSAWSVIPREPTVLKLLLASLGLLWINAV